MGLRPAWKAQKNKAGPTGARCQCGCFEFSRVAGRTCPARTPLLTGMLGSKHASRHCFVFSLAPVSFSSSLFIFSIIFRLGLVTELLAAILSFWLDIPLARLIVTCLPPERCHFLFVQRNAVVVAVIRPTLGALLSLDLLSFLPPSLPPGPFASAPSPRPYPPSLPVRQNGPRIPIFWGKTWNRHAIVFLSRSHRSVSPIQHQ